jgi:hypothetical protein
MYHFIHWLTYMLTRRHHTQRNLGVIRQKVNQHLAEITGSSNNTYFHLFRHEFFRELVKILFIKKIALSGKAEEGKRNSTVLE